MLSSIAVLVKVLAAAMRGREDWNRVGRQYEVHLVRAMFGTITGLRLGGWWREFV